MSGTTPIVRYVVVVHGMGEARKNETVISVVNRFAEARRGQKSRESYDVLTLGSASSQAGTFPRRDDAAADADPFECPWLEFGGIPRAPGIPLPDPFLGDADHSGEHIRFVDCHWGDLSETAYRVAGQAPERWAAGLLGRLERKDAAAAARGVPEQRVPAWARHILRLLEDLLVILHRLFAWRARAVQQTVFVQYLGDVQVYGEFSPLRGRAVRRLHRLLWRIEQRHEREEAHAEAVAAEGGEEYEWREARYTIVAHSLGTVMALDALLLAHASVDAKLATSPAAVASATTKLPYPGFVESPPAADAIEQLRLLAGGRSSGGRRDTGDDARERQRRTLLFGEHGYLNSDWVRRVDSFVTLGSPIDKFLVLWWLPYRFLRHPDDWHDPALAEWRNRNRIRHFNYVDEQDPVGHRLDVARSAPAIRRIFDSETTGEDLVYNRFAIPGLAHVSYWNDLPLFARILRYAVDGEALPLQPEAKSWTQHLQAALKRKAADASALPAPDDFQLHDHRIYLKILAITYEYLPALLGLAATAIFWWAYRAEGAAASAGAMLALLGLGLIGRRLIDLLIWWRGLLRHKGEARRLAQQIRRLARRRWLIFAGASFAGVLAVRDPRPDLILMALVLFLAAIVWRPGVVWYLDRFRSFGWNPRADGNFGVWDVASRQFQVMVFRQDLAILQLVFLALFAMLVGWFAAAWPVAVATGRLAWMGIVLLTGLLLWGAMRGKLLRPADRHSEEGPERAWLVLLCLVLSLAAAGWLGILLRAQIQEGVAHLRLDRLIRQPWLVDLRAELALTTMAGVAAAALIFGYVRYRCWQVHYRLEDEPAARTLGVHLLLVLPEPVVRMLLGKGERERPPDTVDFDLYAAEWEARPAAGPGEVPHVT